MTEKRQTSQGYIIRILQHFATKLRNITNFVMLFQAVMKFLSRSKFHSKGERSITKDAAQPDRVEGFSFKGAYGSHLMTRVRSWSTAMVEGSFRGIIPTHPVNISCGRKPEYLEEPTTLGRALTDSFHIWMSRVRSKSRSHILRGERRLLWWSYATKAPCLWMFPFACVVSLLTKGGLTTKFL
jgi:hypothetical protein